MSCRLARFALTRVRINIVQNEKAQTPRGTKTTWNFGTGFAAHVTEKRNFKVDLKVKFSQYTPDIGEHGYGGEIECVGVVRASNEIPEDKVEAVAYKEGVELLYNTLRGIVLMITGTFNLDAPLTFPNFDANSIVLGDKKKKPSPTKDDNQKAAQLLKEATQTSTPKGESLLGSPELKKQLREAKKRVKGPKKK